MSMEPYDDFWNDDYSEYESFMNDLKDTLKEQIKDKVIAEMDELKREIAALKEFAVNRQKYDNEMTALKYKLKVSEESVEKRAAKMRLKDVMALVEQPAYLIDYELEDTVDKCDKCDDARIIHFYSPSGKEYTEPCPYCNKRKIVYHPVEGRLLSILDKKYKHYEKPEMQGIELSYGFPDYYLEKCLDREKDDFYCEVSRVYNGENLSSCDIYSLKRMYYRSKEECQKVCDYLNKEEE